MRGAIAHLLALLVFSSPGYAGDLPSETTTEAETVQTSPVATAEEQAVEPEQPKGRNHPPGIGEIVVTAQKREEKIQDVPISIAAFNEEFLETHAVRNVADLQQVTAGLQFGSFAGFPLVFLRGVGTDVFLPSEDPSIATYIDGVYIPTSQGVLQGLGGIERVEVLKGPQGTLFGRNATGGAISIVTKKPGDELAASAEVAYGNFNERRAKIFLSGPVTSWLGASLDGIYGRIDNPYSHVSDDVAPEKSLTGRARVDFHPFDTFNVDVGFIRVANDGSGTQVVKNIRPKPAFALLIPAQEDNYVSETDAVGGVKAKHRLWMLNTVWNLPWLDIKLIGSDQFIKSYDSSLDFDGSALPIAEFGSNNLYTKSKSGEIQFVSNGDWGPEQLTWIFGGYILESRLGADPGFFKVGSGLVEKLPLPQPLVDLIDLPPVLADPVIVYFTGLMDTKSASAFFQGTWDFNDQWGITAGGRYQSEKRNLFEQHTDARVGDRAVTVLPFAPQKASYKNFSPKVVLAYRPVENTMVYLSAAQGFKSGTFNTVTTYLSGQYVKPEKDRTVELGIKSDLLDGYLRVNAAVFRTDIKDLHASFVSLTAGGSAVFENAGKALIKGAEADITWVPWPRLSEGLLVTANACYLHSYYEDYQNGSGFDRTTGIYRSDFDFSGNRVVRSPKISGGLGLSHTFYPASGDELQVGIDGYYNDGFYYDTQNSVEESPYSLFNARITYLVSRWNVRATVYGKNLFDEKYHNAVVAVDFGDLSSLAYPAQYGLQLSWSF